ncbi:MAG: sulfatase-like hydrolase/transferase [Planctomycetota bacterium]|jgi:arylsulfatase A-like enzyme/lipopolysaccharide biosynthesis regulator YciM
MRLSTFWKSKLFIMFVMGTVIGAVVVWFVTGRDGGGPRHIVLISIDTLRADHLSCYGYGHRTTPVIDAFAENAVLFENCFSNIPLTLPAHASMLTGLIPPAHGVQDNLGMVLSDSIVTLPEILQAEGYTTYGIISAEVLKRSYGLNQGFDVYDDSFDAANSAEMVAQRTGDETVTHAIKWLRENRDKKTFMFIHFYDPHTVYAPPAPFDKRFQHPYDGEIAFVDHCIGQFLEELKRSGQYDDSLIIVTGDHGEMLGEHGESEHGYFIYQNALRVPLIIKPAGFSKKRRVTNNTTLTDIVPTILAQGDYEMSEPVHGVDLSGYFAGNGRRIDDRFIFNESLTATKYNGNSLLGVINDKWHYIQTTRPELYDLAADPRALNNLIDSEPKRASYLKKQLADILDRCVAVGQGSASELNYESMAAIKSLGYVGGSVDADFSFDQEKPDPKDLLAIHHKFDLINNLKHKGDYDKAIRLCKEILAENPDIAHSYEGLGSIYFEQKEYDKAIEFLKKKVALDPEDLGGVKFLAETYNLAGQYAEAVDQIKRVLEMNPDEISAYSKLADIYMRQEQYGKAAETLQEKLTREPGEISTLKKLASVYGLSGDHSKVAETANEIVKQGQGDAHTYASLAKSHDHLNEFNKALENYQKALKLDQELVTAYVGAGDVYQKTGNQKMAVKHYQIALNKAPEKISLRGSAGLYSIQNTVAWIQATSKDPVLYNPQSALAHAQKIVKASQHPDSPAHRFYPYFLDTLAVAQSANGDFETAVKTAERSIKIFREKGLDASVDEVRQHLNLFKQRKTYRE